MTKVVQTTLDDSEYKSLRDILSGKDLTLKEGLRRAINRFIEEESKIDPSDVLFAGPSGAGSGHGDLAERHDAYLYGEE